MIPELNELAAVLEEEIAVGDELRLNLAAQRHALVAWDMEALIARIEARESCIRSLSELEARRVRIVEAQEASNNPVTLSQLITACPENLPARQRLQSVRKRARETFSRLQADERDLNGLMENLQSHLHEALKPLARPSVPLYGDTGAAALQSPSSALIRSKA
ncbi:MAG: flagellar export chaperone FlgN [Candidatus Binatia bacterium]